MNFPESIRVCSTPMGFLLLKHDRDRNFSERQVTARGEKARNNQEVLARMTVLSADGVAV
jgi:hypothetical protein